MFLLITKPSSQDIGQDERKNCIQFLYKDPQPRLSKQRLVSTRLSVWGGRPGPQVDRIVANVLPYETSFVGQQYNRDKDRRQKTTQQSEGSPAREKSLRAAYLWGTSHKHETPLLRGERFFLMPSQARATFGGWRRSPPEGGSPPCGSKLQVVHHPGSLPQVMEVSS